MKQAFHFTAQAGHGIDIIYDAIESLKALKSLHKEQIGMELDISHELEGIRENLNALAKLTEEEQ